MLAQLAPQFLYLLHTPPRRQVLSTLVSELCLACLHGQANFTTFLFRFRFFSLPSLFSFAPESFPFDPVQNPWLYVLVQKATK